MKIFSPRERGFILISRFISQPAFPPPSPPPSALCLGAFICAEKNALPLKPGGPVKVGIHRESNLAQVTKDQEPGVYAKSDGQYAGGWVGGIFGTMRYPGVASVSCSTIGSYLFLYNFLVITGSIIAQLEQLTINLPRAKVKRKRAQTSRVFTPYPLPYKVMRHGGAGLPGHQTLACA